MAFNPTPSARSFQQALARDRAFTTTDGGSIPQERRDARFPDTPSTLPPAATGKDGRSGAASIS
jgi:hypothetical protein